MPITRKQFELEVDSEVEGWMRKIHSFLGEFKEQAFTKDELAEQLDGFSERYKELRLKGVIVGITPKLKFDSDFEVALEELLETGAVDTRLVRGEGYYRVGPNPLEI
ncbi:MAG: hypothetical protein IBX36_04020 [Dehalococcoidia bacterium]|nr:hypothetical protein [Dehalococcoidia bacterium]